MSLETTAMEPTSDSSDGSGDSATCDAAGITRLHHVRCFCGMRLSFITSAAALWNTLLIAAALISWQAALAAYVLHWHLEVFDCFSHNVEPILVGFMFFAAFMKSYTFSAVVSDIIRFGFLLARDGWRTDTFEAYRRSLLGLAFAELMAGDMYISVWPSMLPAWCWADICLQVLIYVSLDVVPLVCFLCGRSQLAISMGLAAASIHILLFFMAWTCSDLALKVSTFKALRQRLSQTNELADAQCDMPRVENSLDEISFGSSEDIEEIGDAVTCRDTAVDRNLCVKVRRLESMLCSLLPALVCLAMLVAGIISGRIAPILFASFLGAVLCFLSCKWRGSCKLCEEAPFGWMATGISPAALQWQSWGEQFCGLNRAMQAQRYMPVLLELCIVGGVSAFLGYWKLLCLLMVLVAGWGYLFTVAVYARVPWALRLGIAGGVLEPLLMCVIFIVPGFICYWHVAWRRRLFELLCFLLIVCLGRQSGLQKPLRTASLVKCMAMCLFCFMYCLSVAAVLVSTRNDGEAPTDYSSFCDRRLPTCRYYPVPEQPQASLAPVCVAEFHVLMKEGALLSIADFALMSSLTYETSAPSLAAGLQHYFPGWFVEYVHKQRREGRDWISFYEFSNNHTSVIAVQGTADAVDVLQDMDLWTYAAVMAMFRNLIPYGAVSWSKSMMRLCLYIVPNLRQESLQPLFDAVEKRRAENPHRQFFLTGHSLGGGVASLASWFISQKTPNKQLPAIGFAAPGIVLTSTLVFNEPYKHELAPIFVVQPEHDLVSRLDYQPAVSIPLECSGGPIHCHSIFNTVCTVLRQCGPTRTTPNLTLPCGMCPDMPCT
eukprot:TRINITY_DN33725_c0_g1_i2.p1 TRINITY_DN33725_c0_g1~~TRINITY_DN33725_c0_g1_i2.p1  ORF type:complete len:829 (+),score=93.54 TRINITY_DN33725_c0_g1_i2:3-2489(+)